MNSIGRIVCALALSTYSQCVEAAEPPTYVLQLLPSIEGGSLNGEATGINDAGVIVGGFSPTANRPSHPREVTREVTREGWPPVRECVDTHANWLPSLAVAREVLHTAPP